MQSLPSSNSPGRKVVGTAWSVWTTRTVLGAVFVLSGLSKAIDPWGGLFKIGEYFGAWGVDAGRPVLLGAACVLATAELVMGAALLGGCLRRFTAWCATLFMTLMTVLTAYIWIADPVSDCGCFGDAVTLGNGATFAKNLVLLTLAVYTSLYARRARPLVAAPVQWLWLTAAVAYAGIVQWQGYRVQPLVDFRPYPVGTSLYDLSQSDAGTPLFVYALDGRQQTFSADSLPDEDRGWTFVRRQEAPGAAALPAITDSDGADMLPVLTDPDSPTLLLLVSDPAAQGLTRAMQANDMAHAADSAGIQFAAVVAVEPDSLQSWLESVRGEYEAYSADDTDIKMLARGDAALLAINDGKVQWKTNLLAVDPMWPVGNDLTVNPVATISLTRLTMLWALASFVIWLAGHYVRRVYRHRRKPSVTGTDPGDGKTHTLQQ